MTFVNLSYINFESFQEAMRLYKERDYKSYQTFKVFTLINYNNLLITIIVQFKRNKN